MSSVEDELLELQKLFLQSDKIAKFRQDLFSNCLSGIVLSIALLTDSISKSSEFNSSEFAELLSKEAERLSKLAIDEFDQNAIASSVMLQTAASIKRVLEVSEARKKGQEGIALLTKFDISGKKPN